MSALAAGGSVHMSAPQGGTPAVVPATLATPVTYRRRRRISRSYSAFPQDWILSNSVVNKPTVKRLARRAGVKRMSGWINEETRACMLLHIQSVLRDVVLHTTHDHRTTVTAKDVVHALRRSGRNLYGFTV
ncbi:hypothetical protein C8R45DRAFT_984854 [Mycena sanguinolenta]|nr:hypothetical protein C8R45DRAFT_984854 [Mycena sanguinolenta]